MIQRYWFVISLTLCLLCAIALLIINRFIQSDATPYGILSYEFIGSIHKSNIALSAWSDAGKTAVGLSIGIDFLFIALYTIVALQGLRRYADYVRSHAQGLGNYFIFLCYVFPLTSLTDLVENISLILLLLGSQNELWPTLAYGAALIKFSVASACIVPVLIVQCYLQIAKFRAA